MLLLKLTSVAGAVVFWRLVQYPINKTKSIEMLFPVDTAYQRNRPQKITSSGWAKRSLTGMC